MLDISPQKENREVDAVDIIQKHVANGLFLFESICYPIFEGNMPFVAGISLRTAFKILMLVKEHPYKYKAQLLRYCNIANEPLKKGLIYLVEHGYVKTSPHARLILPMDKWTFDTTYVITRTGKALIREVFELSGILAKTESLNKTG